MTSFIPWFILALFFMASLYFILEWTTGAVLRRYRRHKEEIFMKELFRVFPDAEEIEVSDGHFMIMYERDGDDESE